MLEYDFMRHALAAAGIVAVLAGSVGYFLVLREQTFAGHALAHVGFTGATGAVLLGVAPLWGLVSVTVAAGAGMGLMGGALAQRNVAIGIVLSLSLSLGVGLLFLHFYTAFATQATALLFGNVLAVDFRTIWTLLGLALPSIAALALISRPLMFATLQPELAEARGVSLRLLDVLFHHGAGHRRVRADRGRAAGVRADGGAGRVRPAPGHPGRHRPCTVRDLRDGGSMVGCRLVLRDGLAGEFLHQRD